MVGNSGAYDMSKQKHVYYSDTSPRVFEIIKNAGRPMTPSDVHKAMPDKKYHTVATSMHRLEVKKILEKSYLGAYFVPANLNAKQHRVHKEVMTKAIREFAESDRGGSAMFKLWKAGFDAGRGI